MTMSKTTQDHTRIRRWAESRGAHPAAVKGTGGRGDPGILRIDFPGYSGKHTLKEISWDDFFKKFDEEGLEFLYQERTKSGNRSNFNKLISGDSARRRNGSSRTGAAKKKATSSRSRAGTATSSRSRTSTRTPARAKKKTAKAKATRRTTARGTSTRASSSRGSTTRGTSSRASSTRSTGTRARRTASR